MAANVVSKLRPLGERAVMMLHTLLVGSIGGLPPILLPGDSRKIDRGAFMPVCVECVAPGVVSLAHYGEQNGDLMRDPEVCLFTTGDQWYAYYFRNDYVGVEFEHVTLEYPAGFPVPTGATVRCQHDLAEFTEMFLANIMDQQGLAKAPALVVA